MLFLRTFRLALRLPVSSTSGFFCFAVVLVALTVPHATAQSPCVLNPANRTVTICTPGASATVSLPVHLVAAVNNSTPTNLMQVWVDGTKLKQVSSSRLDVYLTGLTAISHSIQVRAQDTAGVWFSKSAGIKVTDH